MKLNFKIVINLSCLFFFLIFAVSDVFCQNSKELDKKKQDNIRQLTLSKSLLEKTYINQKSTLNQLNLIRQNIELRSEIVENVSLEISYLLNDISANNFEIKRAENKVALIKKEYARYIKSAARNLDNDFALLYIFSSDDFNQAYQRIKYLKYLARYRSDLVKQLQNEIENISHENKKLASNKVLNEKLLNERKREIYSLDKDKLLNVTLIKDLQNREVELKRDIQKRERIQDEIEKEIRRIIEEEARKARESRKANVLTPEETLISTDFSRNVGKLPWPSEQGIVTGKYGEQNHPVLKGIIIRSNGIDINTNQGSIVRSVFDGEVTRVIAILGANYTVIIKHGDFRTVYQNLVDVRVKAGDKVKTKTVIGTVFTDQDNISKIHFEVWKDKVTQNPEYWLSK